MTEMFEQKFKESTKDLVDNLYDLFVFVNGEFLKGEEAKISAWEHGLFFGDGVFEGIRAYDGNVFKLDEHLDRLFESLTGLGFGSIGPACPLTKKELREVVLETLRKNKLRDAHVRLIVTRGPGRMGMDPRLCSRPSVYCYAYPFNYVDVKSVKLLTSTIRRKAPHVIDSHIKSINYGDSILAKIQSIAAGCNDALMLDLNGYVSELTGSCVFMIKGGKFSTPTSTSALPSITVATLVNEILPQMGYEVSMRNITLNELYIADEVFACGTGAEIISVEMIDGRPIGIKAPGPMTTKVKETYFEFVRKEHITPYL